MVDFNTRTIMCECVGLQVYYCVCYLYITRTAYPRVVNILEFIENPYTALAIYVPHRDANKGKISLNVSIRYDIMMFYVSLRSNPPSTCRSNEWFRAGTKQCLNTLHPKRCALLQRMILQPRFTRSRMIRLPDTDWHQTI